MIFDTLFKKRMPVYFITDGADWVISEIGLSLESYLKGSGFRVINDEYNLSNLKGILHYSTRYGIYSIMDLPFNRNNGTILTYFHGSDADIELIEKVCVSQHRINVIHTSCNVTRNHLIKYGISSNKIVIIPIGIDLKDFCAVSNNEKEYLRKQNNVPANSFVIGSFQKDGNGWGEGLEPKLIKGPDVFCDVVEYLNSKYKIFVLLTGPARGYVKKRLNKANIAYKHVCLSDYKSIGKFYNMLDLYVITSRLEGGPRALMEAQASGVPVVSTRVGMAEDVIMHGESGYLADIDDISSIIKCAEKIIEKKVDINQIIEQGLITVKAFDYSIIKNHYLAMYQSLAHSKAGVFNP